MIPLAAASAGLQTLAGLGQTLFSGVKKANKNLENFANSYKPNASIMELYDKSLANYSANAYTSQAYQNQTNNINRNLATGLNAAQSRRGGLASLSGLVTGANTANAAAGAAAENQQARNLSLLSQATGMKAREDYKPFEMKYNLLAAKAGAAARTKQQGLQNLFGGLSNGAMLLGGGSKSASGVAGNLPAAQGSNGMSSLPPSDTYDWTGRRNPYAV